MTYRPDSPLIPKAKIEIAKLEEMFAEKSYETGMYYFRDKGYDPAMIYFKQVLESWPDAPKARDAALRLLDSYRAIRYTEEANDVCTSLRTKYPSDPEVVKACPPLAPTASKPAPAVPAKPPAAKPPGAHPAVR
jgi:outer membrane protein assembly factor BamD (BamD/ComL family)